MRGRILRTRTGPGPAEAAARAAAARHWPSILDRISDGVILVSPDWRYVYVNPQAEKLAGKKREELLGQVVWDVFPESVHTPAFAELHRAMAENLAVEYEWYSLPFDRWFRDRAYPCDAGLLILVRDVTEERLGREALRQSQNRFLQIAETSYEGIWAVDAECRTTYANERLARMLGVSTEALAGRPALEFIQEASLAQAEAVWERCRRGAREQNDFCLRRADGGDLWTICATSPILNDRGEFSGVLAMVTDITDRREAEEALRHSEEQLRTILHEAAIGIARVSLEGCVLDSNAAFQQMLGYSADELRGGSALGLLYPEDRELGMALFQELLSGKRAHYQVERRYVRKDGAVIWARQIGSLVRDAGGGPRFAIAMLEDITPRKQFEEALENSEAQLRQMQRLEAVGRLAGGVAHDFNNMLAVINGYADLLLELADEGSPLRSGLEEIRRAGERSAQLTRQLLAFSRKQILAPQVLDLGRVIRELEGMLRRLIGEDIELVARLAPNTGFIEADPGQIEQVLMNLAVNARDAMPRGGRLTLATDRVDLAYEEALRLELAPGPYVLLTVSDTGEGIEREILSHIFEPFFTTKGAGRGTGLGLATVYGIVKQSEGHVEVESAPGQGATFRVFLPQSRQPAEAAGPEREERASGGSETVLLVEDEEMLRRMIRRVLEGCGYRVLEAANAVEALSVFRRHEAPVHLLVTDMVMPGPSGRELAEQLTRLSPQMKVLLMSGYTEEMTGPHGGPESETPFIEKPFSTVTLAEKVRQVLDRRA